MCRRNLPAALLLPLTIAAFVCGCRILERGDGSADLARASTAFAGAFSQTLAQDAVTEPGGVSTRAYTSPVGGAAKLVFSRAAGSAPSGEANAWGGTIIFADYHDATTGSVMNGSLACAYYNTPSASPGTAYTSYNNVTGTVTFSGGFTSRITFDCLVIVHVAASGSRTQSLLGTASVNGTWYDLETGTQTGAALPTVTFNPPTSADAAGGLMSVTMNCPGADLLYYTTDGSLPGSKSSTAPPGTALTAVPSGSVVMAYALSGGKPGRTSLFVYPAY